MRRRLLGFSVGCRWELNKIQKENQVQKKIRKEKKKDSKKKKGGDYEKKKKTNEGTPKERRGNEPKLGGRERAPGRCWAKGILNFSQKRKRRDGVRGGQGT